MNIEKIQKWGNQYKRRILITFIECLFIGFTVFLCSQREKSIMTVDLLENANASVSASNIEGNATDMIVVKDQHLSKGIYTVNVVYKSDTKDNTCALYTTDEEELSSIITHTTPLSPDSRHASLTAWVYSDVDHVSITVYYAGIGNLEVESFELKNAGRYYNIQLFYLFGLFLLTNFVMFFLIPRWNQVRDNRMVILALTVAILFSSLPLFVDYLPTIWGHDIMFHIMRIGGLAGGLKDGQFPVRIQPGWLDNNGYCVSVMYPDLFLYIPAFLHNMGFRLQVAYKIFVFLMNAATCLVAYYSIKELFKDKYIGVVGSILYVLSSYRFVNVYLRTAVGEALAFVFFPLVFCGLYKILREDADKEKRKGCLLAIIGYTGIIQSHILSCEIIGIFTVLFCLFCFKDIWKKKNFLLLVIAAVSTLLLNAGFLIPFLDYYLHEPMRVTTSDPQSFLIQNAGVYITQLFAFFQNGYGVSLGLAEGMNGEMALGIGGPLVVGLVLVLFCIVEFIGKGNGQEKDSREQSEDKKSLLLFFILGCIAMLLTSNYFPWNKIQTMNDGIGRLVSNLQFPWRFLTMATICLVLAVCGAMHIYRKRGESCRTMALVILVLAFLSFSWIENSYMNSIDAWRPNVVQDIDSTNAMIGGEYLLQGTDTELLHNNTYRTSENVEIKNYEKHYLTIITDLVTTGGDGFIEVPLLDYIGYTARGSRGEVFPVTPGTNNQVHVAIPSGYDGTVTIKFTEPFYWRMAEVVSLLTLVGIVVIYVRKRKI